MCWVCRFILKTGAFLMSQADVPLRIIVGRLRATVNALAFQVGIISQTVTSGITFVDDLTQFRAHNLVTLPSTSVILSQDAQGDAGIFRVDPFDANPNDDGINRVIDASGRHWIRQVVPV